MAEKSLLGMKVLEHSMMPADAVLMVRNGAVLHRFIWTANALAEQEREIEALRLSATLHECCTPWSAPDGAGGFTLSHDPGCATLARQVELAELRAVLRDFVALIDATEEPLPMTAAGLVEQGRRINDLLSRARAVLGGPNAAKETM